MNKFTCIALVLYICIACNKKEIKIDLPLSITDSDTVFINVGNLRYQNAKFHITDPKNFLIIHQDRKLWWYNLIEDSITRSVNLDTTNLVIPEVSILQARYQERDSSLILFFPQRNKIVNLNSSLEIKKETDLSGIEDFDHMYMPYGDAFFYEPSIGYVIGIMNIKTNDHQSFLNEMKFVGVFDEVTGKLKNTFGEFGDKRKSVESMVLSEGIFHIDFRNGDFFLREVIADQTIHTYSISGVKRDSYSVGTSKIESEIFPHENGNDFFSLPRSDQFYSMKVTESGLVVSNTFSTKIINESLKYYSYLLIEDLKKGVSYSTSIDPFQKILWASNSEIYLVRNHPDTEDMILVKLKYKLGESSQD